MKARYDCKYNKNTQHASASSKSGENAVNNVTYNRFFLESSVKSHLDSFYEFHICHLTFFQDY